MSATVDTSEADAFFKGARLTEADMLTIEKPMAAVVSNTQKLLVPVDTGATKVSIGADIQFASALLVIDHIGPKTDYSKYIEFGVVSKPNYPIQPFVRPSVFGAKAKEIERIAEKGFKRVMESKGA